MWEGGGAGLAIALPTKSFESIPKVAQSNSLVSQKYHFIVILSHHMLHGLVHFLYTRLPGENVSNVTAEQCGNLNRETIPMSLTLDTLKSCLILVNLCG